MGTQLGEAQIPIRATLDKLDGDLAAARGKVEGALGKMASRFGGAIQSLGKVALGAGGLAIGALAGIGAAAAKLAVDAAPVAGVASAFAGLAESAGVGSDEMVAALKRGSAGMVAQRDLMKSFNQAASLVSIDFAKQLPDAMGYLGKVAASTGQDMGFLLDSLVKGVGRVSPMILDNLAIQVNLSQATERASEMFGVEAEELTKAQQQAGMMNVVLEKLAENTASMPDVSESAAAKMAQLKATFQDTKDTASMALLPVLSQVADIVTSLLPALDPVIAAFSGFIPTIQSVVGAIGTFVSGIVAGGDPIAALAAALSELLPPEVAEPIVDAIRSIREGIQTVIEAVAPYVAMAMVWIGQNVQLSDVLIALGIAIAAVVLPALWSVVAAAAPVIAAAVALVAIVMLLRKAWESDFLGMRTFILDTLSKIRAWWTAHGDEVLAKAKEIWEAVRSAVKVALAFLQRNIEAFIAVVREWWAEHGDEVLAKAKEVWEAVRSAVKVALAFLERNIGAFIATVKEWWAEHGDEVLAKAEEVWEAVVATFEWFKGVFMDVYEAFRLAFEGDWYGFGEKLRDAWDKVWEKIREIGKLAWEAIRKFFTETDWGSIGKGILEGVAKGITAGLKAIKDAARNAARAALEAAKGFLRAGSPSMEFMRLGEFAAEGFALGLGSTDVIERAAAAMGRMAVQDTGAVAASLAGQPAGTTYSMGGIYGAINLHGVQSPQGFLEQMQALM